MIEVGNTIAIVGRIPREVVVRITVGGIVCHVSQRALYSNALLILERAKNLVHDPKEDNRRFCTVWVDTSLIDTVIDSMSQV